MKISPLFLIVLAGCASQPYVPYAVEVGNQAAYSADLAQCQTYAAAHKTKLDPREIGESAGEGAVGNAAGAAVNPYVPLIGAAGNATQTVLSEVGLSQADRKRITAICMKAKLDADHSALALDPNQ
jgi:hypothetical protein